MKLNEITKGKYVKLHTMIFLIEKVEAIEHRKFIIHAKYALCSRKGAKPHINYVQRRELANFQSDLEKRTRLATTEEIAKLHTAIKMYESANSTNHEVDITNNSSDMLLLSLQNIQKLTDINRELLEQNKILITENKDLRDSLEKISRDLK